jgi:DNA polymerase-3 subunit delta'
MGFSGVNGQSRAIATLRSALAGGRIAHAYLFAGPDGVGKETVAWAFTQALLCDSGGSSAGEACGRCGPCRRVVARGHPDVQLVVPEKGVIPIDRVRDLCGRLALAPFEARYQVAILRDAHLLNPPAQNALLKTLEEPPGSAVLVLVSAAPHLLLPTVRSRCQRIAFAPLDGDLVRGRVAETLGRAPDDPDVILAAALGEGSLGRALSIAAEGAYSGRQELIQAALALSPDHPGAVLDLAEAWGSDRTKAGEALEILQLWYRDRLLESVGAEGRCLPDLPAPFPISSGAALQLLDRLHEARRGLLVNVSPQLTLERTLFALAEAHGGRA